MTIQERPGGRVVEYPTSDGEPMAETDLHRDIAVYIIQALQRHFKGQTVYVAGNNFLYYEEGNPAACVSPDAYVVFGIAMKRRDSYKAWEEEGHLPNVVFEFTSRKTRRVDAGLKRQRYEERLRVPEYFLFDPTADYLRPPLQGFRLVEGAYVPLELVDGRLHSEQLHLDLVQEGDWLRLWDPRQREWLFSHEETQQREEEALRQVEFQRRRADEEAAARAEAEVENARLREMLAALRGESPAQ